jgi:oligoendopeptidase F
MTLIEPGVAVVHPPTRWTLAELLPDRSPQSIALRFRALEQSVAAFEARRGHLAGDMGRHLLTELLDLYEDILQQMTILTAYGSLWFSEDTQSREAQGFRNRLQQVLTAAQNRILFFELWWKALGSEDAARLLPTAAESADRRHFLEELRRFEPYTLDERSEQLINLKDANGVSTLLTLYSMLTNRLEFRLTVDGEERGLTRDGLMSFAFAPRRELRVAAYRELYRVYEQDATVFAQIYLSRVRDWACENVEQRGFTSPIAVRNLSNDIPDAAVETLLEVVRANRTLFHRYFHTKARLLGMERLHRYDLYAPLAASDKNVPYAEAVRSVLETLDAFHPTFATMARRVFDQQHIDSEVRKGKRGGAFCLTVMPPLTPWVLVNYTGRVRDVATLAHELGHAIHSMLAEGHGVLTQNPSLPLAETASVFSEILMTDRLLAEERDPLARRELLAAFLDDVYATVLRQAYFVLFEKAAHAAVSEGASLDDLNRLYLENLADQFADAVEISPEFQYEWLSIPHIFHTPFYCYAYSFGQLLVLALYRRYQQEGERFKPGYLRLLAYGGSDRPERILREAGIDITDPGFWQGGFSVVEERLRELEQLEAVPRHL